MTSIALHAAAVVEEKAPTSNLPVGRNRTVEQQDVAVVPPAIVISAD
jgi:hypothetical protein